MFCSNTNSTLSRTIDCSLLTITTDKNDGINVYKEDGTFDSYNISSRQARAYLGNYDGRANITSPVTTSKTGYFVLPHLEFKFDTYITGFEVYAVNPGLIYFYVKKFLSLFFF